MFTSISYMCTCDASSHTQPTNIYCGLTGTAEVLKPQTPSGWGSQAKQEVPWALITTYDWWVSLTLCERPGIEEQEACAIPSDFFCILFHCINLFWLYSTVKAQCKSIYILIERWRETALIPFLHILTTPFLFLFYQRWSACKHVRLHNQSSV